MPFMVSSSANFFGFTFPRYKEIDRARAIYERFTIVHPEVKNWIRYAKFEEGHGFIKSSRSIYERAVEFFGEEYMDEKLFIAFAKFEENQKEHDRARVIYKYALDLMPKESCTELYKVINGTRTTFDMI